MSLEYHIILDTSPTQDRGKVGARSGQKARFGQGRGKVRARFGHEIVIMGLISDRGRR